MIFLSASIPDPRKNEKYFLTADNVAIRDAVRALATVLIPKTHIVWGGHPAITPLIRYVMSSMNLNGPEHITLYQSNHFKKSFPKDNEYFENVIFTDDIQNNEYLSLVEMRLQMLNHKFQAGIFIGGMEGVELEYDMFKRFHPEAKVFPIASTGAAAKLIYDRIQEQQDKRLEYDYAYMALFRNLFDTIIN